MDKISALRTKLNTSDVDTVMSDFTGPFPAVAAAAPVKLQMLAQEMQAMWRYHERYYDGWDRAPWQIVATVDDDNTFGVSYDDDDASSPVAIATTLNDTLSALHLPPCALPAVRVTELPGSAAIMDQDAIDHELERIGAELAPGSHPAFYGLFKTRDGDLLAHCKTPPCPWLRVPPTGDTAKACVNLAALF